MSEKPRRRSLPTAEQDVGTGRHHVTTEQTQSPSYRLAFADEAFLLEDNLRGVRLMLEYLKPERRMRDAGIHSTVVVFGSTRIRPTDAAASDKTNCTLDPSYYDEARRLGTLIAESTTDGDELDYVVMTGGGPGIMEAANRGAADAGAPSVGLNIVLPREQVPNRYITPDLSFQFHYFAVRKLHFLLRARALVFFPGGFGTLDELFEALTLLQTGRIDRIPVLLFGESFWRRVIDFDALLEIGVISAEDLAFIRFVESADEALAII
ncbi:MAG: hypothetical protein GWN29_05705, partial [Gammaproteobacteria bacterium]|nr:hypothetical protein [Gammaproteobacteria bacterium]